MAYNAFGPYYFKRKTGILSDIPSKRRVPALMKQPLIGISGSITKDEKQHFLLRCYMQRLTENAAIPLLLSPDMDDGQIDACAWQLDGLMLAGGNDIDPALYGHAAVAELGEVNPLRDRLEMRLIPAFLRENKPIFGICRGIQALNVALGGTLYQDLPSQYADTPATMERIVHSQPEPYESPAHTAHILPGSLLGRITGAEQLAVNSMHHQAVWLPAPGLTVCARAGDGVIEGVEIPDKPFVLAVQWHPERLADEASRRLFAAFARAAGEKTC